MLKTRGFISFAHNSVSGQPHARKKAEYRKILPAEMSYKVVKPFAVFAVIATLCLLVVGPAGHVNAQIVSGPVGFWDNVNVSFGVGIHNFHGDFDGPRIQTGAADSPTGVPFAPNGRVLTFRLDKPLPWPRSTDFKLKATAGLEHIYFQSPGSNKWVTTTSTTIQRQPITLINRGYGPVIGFAFEYQVNDRISIEPVLNVSLLINNPTADGLYDLQGTNLIVDRSVPANVNLRGTPLTRATGEPEPPLMTPKILAGIRMSSAFIGNYRWYIDYGIGFFMNDYFDNTSAAIVEGPTSGNDRLTHLQAGVQFPMSVEKRASQTTEKKQVRIDRKKIAKIERIQNIANLITSDEDLLELQKILSDKILLYDTPGVRFNELAAKCIERKIPLGDSQIMTDMIEVPGGSYIIGLTAVDELEVQVQGRKRITINPFLIDKYEVTNEQYRTFLVAMKALPAPLPVNPADTLTSKFNYGSTIEWQELVRRAALQDYANHARPPQLNGPGDLMPADSMWTKYGLNDVIPWDTYFYDPYYDNYPVVCISWYQARLFAAWSGKRLLTESEWEYTSRSGVSGRVYPWDGLDVQTKTGKFRANFKQSRGVYDEDGYAIMSPVDSYLPNDFGLYNTSGNVSEWVLDAWNPSYVVLQNVGTSNFVSPYYANDQEPRKIHRGGSWQSTKFYIGVGVRNFQDKNAGSPFVGFRCGKSMTRTYR